MTARPRDLSCSDAARSRKVRAPARGASGAQQQEERMAFQIANELRTLLPAGAVAAAAALMPGAAHPTS